MLRRGLAILLLICGTLTTTGALPGAAAHGARPVTVLSFNIHHAEGTDGLLDLDRVARVIRRSRADVVGLQEVDRHYSGRSDWADQAGALAERLGYHVVFGANIDRDPPAPGRPRIQYGTAILSRYPIVRWDNTYLYRSPDQEQRGLLHAELDVRGAPMHVYNTHLAASSRTDRLEQTRQLTELIGDTQPAVLVGDLNALPSSEEIATLEAKYSDAWVAAGQGAGATYPAEEPDRRIDYVFTGEGVRPVWAKVVSSEPVASDHLPLVCRLVVEPTL